MYVLLLVLIYLSFPEHLHRAAVRAGDLFAWADVVCTEDF